MESSGEHMKLISLTNEEISDFNQPIQTDADKIRGDQIKIKSLLHHKNIVSSELEQLNDLNDLGKLTPNLRQKLELVEKRWAAIENQLKQFNIVVGKSKIPNPLSTCEIALWAGPPDQYPDLTGTQVKLLNEIQDILVKSGIPPLTVLYGGRRSHAYKGINFVATNADKSFAWRKYDPSPGAGQNWVYFSGAMKMKDVNEKGKMKRVLSSSGSMNTSDFVADPKKYLPTYKK